MFLAERGGQPLLTELRWTSLRYGRRLDQTSDAGVTLGLDALRDEDCCYALSVMRAWEHELVVYRSPGVGEPYELAWVGPVGDPTFGEQSVDIPARDLSYWFERRVMPTTRTFTDVDLGTIFEQIVTDALSRDTSPNITVSTSNIGVTGTRSIVATEYPRAADLLSELARTGIDWTMLAREMLAGGEEVPTPSIGTLTDDVLAQRRLVELGTQAASEAIVIGSSGTEANTPIVGVAGGIGADIGLVQTVRTESEIKDAGSAVVAAQGDIELYDPPPFNVDGRLMPETAITFNELVAGARVDARLTFACREISQVMRMLTLDVSAASDPAGGQTEEVTVTLQSLGATDL